MNNVETALFRDKQIGFFIYLTVEAIMFLTLFSTYLIFTPSQEGPHPSAVFDATIVLLSSFFLLSSSGTLLIAEKGLKQPNGKQLFTWIGITLLFGLIFLAFEILEFSSLVTEGYGLTVSSFLSAYYVLVSLHAAHVLFGCGWMIVLFTQGFGKPISFPLFLEKFKIFSYYWHFVDGVWVFIILIVYSRYLF